MEDPAMVNYHMVEDDDLEFISVATVDDLPSGHRIILDVDGEPIAVFNIAGEYFAISDICSHDEGSIAEGDLVGHSIECPRHGARFDLRTGKAQSLPAVVDIPAYPVRVVGDEIRVGLPAFD
jgi:3-phenylpropionate/trans-cinnamate dioxygenase ferredoxin subunit